ncbi:amidophosphoribosyltransferase [Candidatus Photodesmus katoptron]|uniref:Amidophosphoribosyltransferase n=1 Tax=Candidatus Photodesmus katoptron Akat1 TaxID=1236703 RepID=S3DZQ5_9GAMM|nr:amidophosphoribosyltransferase [Candidatus Photodesmus katoptron]EPE37436.1 amidophosphoribosyltransferase [Candidatus Photodesmus katoptron Akat1]KEY90163.1 amidophosphoribosyltransferase [Candidatus Photodesmus katoptron]
MCGVVGVVGTVPVNQVIYDALIVLQHRGQDASGICIIENNCFRLHKNNGLVRDVFQSEDMQHLQSGNFGIGHVRYPTAGTSSASEAQPFFVNSPFGITLAHNGNLTNAHQVRKKLFEQNRRHVNTNSDSEVLLNVLAHEIDKVQGIVTSKDVFQSISNVHKIIRGGYAVVAMIIEHGLIAFRDPNGIRPLCLGMRKQSGSFCEYMVASESVALNAVGFDFVRDVAPGEAIYITFQGEIFTQQCADKPRLTPCIFEFVYFARPDSFIDKISVYSARIEMGKKLGQRIKEEYSHLDIDVVIPIPETSCDIALQIAYAINKPYRQGFVKNRYVGRTFIMYGQKQRKESVRRKLNAISSEFKDKNVLLVDDSIVRGTTSKQIVEMAHDSGARQVFMVSAAPEIRFPNVYGINMPNSNDLIAYRRNSNDICKRIGANELIFQRLNDLVDAVGIGNPDIDEFETSVFSGIYVTGDIDQKYLDFLESQYINDT